MKSQFTIALWLSALIVATLPRPVAAAATFLACVTNEAECAQHATHMGFSRYHIEENHERCHPGYACFGDPSSDLRGGSPNGFNTEARAAIDRMNASLASAIRNGNVNHDFITLMIPHHQGAIDIAQAYLRYGTDPRLREMAEKASASQSEEIAKLRQIVKEYPAR